MITPLGLKTEGTVRLFDFQAPKGWLLLARCFSGGRTTDLSYRTGITVLLFLQKRQRGDGGGEALNPHAIKLHRNFFLLAANNAP